MIGELNNGNGSNTTPEAKKSPQSSPVLPGTIVPSKPLILPPTTIPSPHAPVLMPPNITSSTPEIIPTVPDLITSSNNHLIMSSSISTAALPKNIVSVQPLPTFRPSPKRPRLVPGAGDPAPHDSQILQYLTQLTEVQQEVLRIQEQRLMVESQRRDIEKEKLDIEKARYELEKERLCQKILSRKGFRGI